MDRFLQNILKKLLENFERYFTNIFEILSRLCFNFLNFPGDHIEESMKP